MKTALITGSAGQDGTYLSAHLAKLGYKVIGIDSTLGSIDLRDAAGVFALLKNAKPQEIYHLAAFHHSSQDKLTNDLDVFRKSDEVHVVATANLLEGIKRFCQTARFFYAASCHVYGNPATPIQNETTPFCPDGLYGITKQAGAQLCRYYRCAHNLFAAVGILYNHESPLRPANFVSKKIVEAAVAISNRQQEKLVLGDLETEIDWGFAVDYVVAMHQILQLPVAEDVVISSGEKHRIRDFVEEAFKLVGLDWRQYVVVDPTLLRGEARTCLFGDNTKLRKMTGWKPTTSFQELVKIMITAEQEKRRSQ